MYRLTKLGDTRVCDLGAVTLLPWGFSAGLSVEDMEHGCQSPSKILGRGAKDLAVKALAAPLENPSSAPSSCSNQAAIHAHEGSLA